MTQEQTVIRATVGMLELARQLGNVSQARWVMGCSCDSFYRFTALVHGDEAGRNMSLGASETMRYEA